MKKKNLIGQRFGKLTVITELPDCEWICRCDCGSFKTSCTVYLTSGDTGSCGCIPKGGNRLTHGHTIKKSPSITWHSWSSMKQRCLNKKNPAYCNYGGRGIKVCRTWMSFENFLADMGEKPIGMTLGRIDNNGNYCKSNCRWETTQEQSVNTRKTVFVTCNNLTIPLPVLTRNLGVNLEAVRQRLKRGWPIEIALTQSLKRDYSLKPVRRLSEFTTVVKF